MQCKGEAGPIQPLNGGDRHVHIEGQSPRHVALFQRLLGDAAAQIGHLLAGLSQQGSDVMPHLQHPVSATGGARNASHPAEQHCSSPDFQTASRGCSRALASFTRFT